MEKWKDIPGYEGLYMVSDRGRVLSLVMWDGHRYVKNKRIIDGWIQKTGRGNYRRRIVALSKSGDRRCFKIHRLVATVFLPNPESKEVVNHIDGNPLNNELSNLEWATQNENVEHAWSTGLVGACYRDHKEDIIKDYESGMTVRQIEKKYHCNWKSVRKMLVNEGIKIVTNSERKTIYQIDLSDLLSDFKQGKRNVDLAKKFNTNRHLIAAYKCRFKKENLI